MAASSDRLRDAAVRRFATYRHNPRAFVHDLFRDAAGRPVELEPYQAEILEALAAGRDVTVRSGHGVGKTAVDAFATFWFLLTHPRSKVITTAPTFRQVKDVLWAEIAKWYQGFRLREYLTLTKTRLAVRGREAEWCALGVSSNRPSNIEGFHAPAILYVVDEAKGVPAPIFDSIDGALTTGGQRLYTSTPGSRIGRFYESHAGRLAQFFVRIHVNGETCRRIDARWLAQKREEWGVDSPVYQAKVRGEFPDEGDDVLIPLAYLLAAEDAWLERRCATCRQREGACGHEGPFEPAVPHGSHRVLGVDVARYGFDSTAVVYGSVGRLEWVRTWRRCDLVETTGRIVAIAREEGDVEAIAVDDTGLGGGVTDQLLRIHGLRALPVLFGARSALDTDDLREHFRDNKAYLAWTLRRALEETWQARDRGEIGTFALCRDDTLHAQLASLRVRATPRGQLSVVDPDEVRDDAFERPAGVKGSPDRAHAAILCYYAGRRAVSDAVGVFQTPEPLRRGQPATPDPRRRFSSYVFGGRGPRLG